MKALIRIVDDDEELARSYALLLETAGWECRVWTDGTRFLEEGALSVRAASSSTCACRG